MAIRVRGTITITRKEGRHGGFNVGDLVTDVGLFEVKDALIEEFEPGNYTGEFLIAWIEPDSFAWRGKVFVKQRATLAEILIDEADEGGTPPAQPHEPDPIEATAGAEAATPGARPASAPAGFRSDTQTSVSAAAGSAKSLPAQIDHDPAAKADTTDPDAKLFGPEIYALLHKRETIKLDPTTERQLFRQQRDRLKDLGYSFDAKPQTWVVRELAEA
jgi:Protein of unknown function (DUF3275)